MANIHTTSLWSFLSCPYKFHFDKSERNYSALDFWTKAHLAIENAILWLKDWVSIILDTCSIADREKIMIMINIVQQTIKDYWYTYVMWEYKLNHVDDKTRIEWTFDQLYKDKDGKYHMVDLKTAAWEWKDEQRDQQVQWYIYPTMLFNTTWIKCEDFEYWVLTKHSIPRLYKYKFEDVVRPEKLDEWLKQYNSANETDIWIPNFKSYLCQYCKLWHMCGKRAWAYEAF